MRKTMKKFDQFTQVVWGLTITYFHTIKMTDLIKSYQKFKVHNRLEKNWLRAYICFTTLQSPMTNSTTDPYNLFITILILSIWDAKCNTTLTKTKAHLDFCKMSFKLRYLIATNGLHHGTEFLWGAGGEWREAWADHVCWG